MVVHAVSFSSAPAARDRQDPHAQGEVHPKLAAEAVAENVPQIGSAEATGTTAG